MRDKWLRIGCFLTGYNFNLIKHSSEDAHRVLKKNTAAIFVISLLWGFIGFLFSKHYLGTNMFGSLVASGVAMFIIIQVERQIILSKSGWSGVAGAIFRFLLGVTMAILGSLITDQIIFANDIKQAKKLHAPEYVKASVELQKETLNNKITRNDSLILDCKTKVNDYRTLPAFENINLTSKTTNKDSSNKVISTVETDTEKLLETIEKKMIPDLLNQIKELHATNDSILSQIVNLEDGAIEKFIDEKSFLVEIKLLFEEMFKKENWPMLFVYILFFSAFFSIEMLILFNKLTESETDYDELIHFQKEIRKEQIKNLKQNVNAVV